ncbi:MAG: M6 family metalloprotease domain-containing protein [Candidatus Zixiibacteriota bacterium]
MRTRTILFLVAAALAAAVLVVGTADAMPPHPSLLEKMAHDGDAQAAPLMRSCPQPHLAGAPDGRGLGDPIRIDPASNPQTSGNILCILIEFSDKPATATAVSFDSLLFGSSTGTVKNYYSEVSYGTFDVVTVNYPSALDWQEAPQTYAYYCNGDNGLGTYPNNSQKLFEDIVDLVDPLVNFANYDINSDGYVDAIMLVHTGSGAELTGDADDIWSHAWGITPRQRDGKWISRYAIMPEFWYTAGDMTIGVFAHEMGHAYFGYPDLYDIDYSSNGIGRWSLMAGGSWNGSLGNSPAHPDAWSRIEAGFATATNVVSNVVNQSLPNVEQNSSGAIFRLWTNGGAGNQYFLIENRQKTGYDAGLPGAGMLVWHIDEAMATGDNTDNADEWYPGHTSSGHMRVALEQADGLFELEKKGDNGDTGDPFPGLTVNTSFSGLSNPNSDDYNSSQTLVSVTNISASASTMTADLAVSLVADVDDYTYDNVLPGSYSLDQNFPNPFNPSTRISFDLPKSGLVHLTVFNILGEKIEDLVDGYLPAGKHSITWQPNNDGTPLASGVYLYKLNTEEASISRKMLLLK